MSRKEALLECARSYSKQIKDLKELQEIVKSASDRWGGCFGVLYLTVSSSIKAAETHLSNILDLCDREGV